MVSKLKYFWVLLLFITFGSVSAAVSQSSYLTDVGYPNYGTELTLPIGYVNVSNGNVHIPIPLSSISQRGKLSASVHLDYDSKIWQIVEVNGAYSWQPVNVPQRSFNGTPAQSGWRFQLGDGAGTAQWGETGLGCSAEFGPFSFTDQNGTNHQFPFYTTEIAPYKNCSGTDVPSNNGIAVDQSGYQAVVTNYTTITVFDAQGNQVYPYAMDTNGNAMELDTASGTLKNTNGLTIAGFTAYNPNGTQTISTPTPANADNALNTITYETISVSTNFGQSDVAEFSGTLIVPQTLQLPDGTEYQFTYDSGTGPGHYGELTQITLPRGGTISFSYSNYIDSYNNENRWLTSVLSNGGTTTYSPSVISGCQAGSSGCQEQVVETTPAKDDTVYTMTLNQGAWNTSISRYTGARSGGGLILTTNSANTFSQSTTTPGCTSGGKFAYMCYSTWLTKNVTTTTMAATGQQIVKETDYTNANTSTPWFGVPLQVSTTDFFTGSTTPSPLQVMQYGYQSLNVSAAPFGSEYLISTATQDGSGNTIQSKHFAYDQTDIQPSPQFPQTSASGPHGGNLTNILGDSEDWYMYYDYAGALQSMVDANGVLGGQPWLHTTSFTYDQSDSLVTQVTRPTTNGTSHVSTASYNPFYYSLEATNDEDSVASGSSSPITYTYYTGSQGINTGKLQKMIMPDGGTVTYAWDDANYLTTTILQNGQTQASAQITTYYDPYNRVAEIYGNGINQTYTYDSMGRSVCTSHPFYASGSSSTDGSDCVTSWDGLNRPLVLTHPDGKTIRYSYSGNRTTVTDETGRSKAFVYDGLGRLSQVFEPDSSGGLNWETDYSYDAAGRMLSVVQKGGSSNPASWLSRTWTYDNASGWLIQSQTPEQGQICYGSISGGSCYYDYHNPSYDNNGNVLLINDGNGTHSFTYDALNRLTSETSTKGSSSVTQTLTYDVAPTGSSIPVVNGMGRLTAAVDSSGGGEFYQYDAVGRLASQYTCFSSANCSSVSSVMSATYDYVGNPLSLTYPDGRTVVNTYDINNHLLQSQYAAWGGQALSAPINYWSSATYLPGGQVQGAQLGSSVQMAASFTNRETLSGLAYATNSSNLWGKAYSWDKNAQNLLQTTDALSGVSRIFAYDSVNRLVSAADVTASQPTYATATVLVSGIDGSSTFCTGGGGGGTGTESAPAGQTTAQAQPQIVPPTKCTVVFDSGTVSLTVGAATANANYGKGSTALAIASTLAQGIKGSLVSAQATSGPGVGQATISLMSSTAGSAGDYAMSATSTSDFSVTPSGSSMTGGGQGTTPVPGGMNIAYSYDPFGNLSIGSPTLQFVNNQISDAAHTYSPGGGLASDSSHSYIYDPAGRVVYGQNMSPTANYTYDAGNVRLTKTDASGQTGYISFGGVPMAVLNPSGTWTDFIRADGRFIAEVAGTPTATPMYRLTDHLGSLALLTDANGNPQGQNDYFPYGQLFSSSASDNYQFTGLERNSDTETTTALERDYLDFQGRWMVPDPDDGSYDWTNPQSLNRYAYVKGQPLFSTDPSGLDPDDPSNPDYGFLLDSVINFFKNLFGAWGGDGPVFSGSTTPLPENAPGTGNPNYDDPLNETLGLPKGTKLPDLTLAGVLNFPAPGCEFGSCGSGSISFGLTGPGGGSNPLSVNSGAISGSIVLPFWYFVAGPAFSFSYDPKNHLLCGGFGGGLSAGHTAGGGPVVVHARKGKTSKDVLSGWSLGGGYNWTPWWGYQGSVGSSGYTAGYSFGVPGASGTVTYSWCRSGGG